MALSLRVIPGYQFAENEKMTQVKLNQLGRPTVELQGTISAALIPPGSITSDKLSPLLISGLTGPLRPLESSDLMMVERAGLGLRNTTVQDVLNLGVKPGGTIQAVGFHDFAWIIQATGGANQKATIEDTLREAINGQGELTGAAGSIVDPLNDMLLVFDASQTAGSNKNRKAKVKTAVTAVTNTLIADAPPMPIGTLDKVNDMVLVRDVTATPGAQQYSVKLSDFVQQVAGIRAWVNFDGTVQLDVLQSRMISAANTLEVHTFDSPNNKFLTNLRPGDWIWFDRRDIAGNLQADTPYYVYPLPPPDYSLELYSTQAAAVARDQSKRITIAMANQQQVYFFMWRTPPIRASLNVSSVMRGGTDGNDTGKFRINFATSISTYATLITSSQREDHGGDGIIGAIDTEITPPTANFVEIMTKDDGGANADAAYINVLIVG